MGDVYVVAIVPCRHKRTHQDIRPFSCPVCAKRFSQLHVVTAYVPHAGVCKLAYNSCRHMRTHTGERPFACPKCQRSFSVLANMKRWAARGWEVSCLQLLLLLLLLLHVCAYAYVPVHVCVCAAIVRNPASPATAGGERNDRCWVDVYTLCLLDARDRATDANR